MNLPNELRQYAEDIFSVTGPNPQATMMSLAADEIVALMARVQEMREALGKVSMEANFFDVLVIARTANEALATPDTSAAILARRDAAVWVEAAEVCESNDMSWADAEWNAAVKDCGLKLRARCDELLKGLEKEYGN